LSVKPAQYANILITRSQANENRFLWSLDS